jgi:hypothetical protein
VNKIFVVISFFAVVAAGIFAAFMFEVLPTPAATSGVSEVCSERIDAVVATYGGIAERVPENQSTPFVFPSESEIAALENVDPVLHELYRDEKTNTILYELQCSFAEGEQFTSDEAERELLSRLISEAGRDPVAHPTSVLAAVTATRCSLYDFKVFTGVAAPLPGDIQQTCDQLA